jgi:hypothetical protein
MRRIERSIRALEARIVRLRGQDVPPPSETGNGPGTPPAL